MWISPVLEVICFNCTGKMTRRLSIYKRTENKTIGVLFPVAVFLPVGVTIKPPKMSELTEETVRHGHFTFLFNGAKRLPNVNSVHTS